MKKLAGIVVMALALVGCTGAEIAGAGAAVLGGGLAAFRQAQEAPGSPTEGPVLPPPPTPGGSLWWWIGSVVVTLAYAANKRRSEG